MSDAARIAARLATLTALFQEIRALVARPDNDFTWTSWIDTAHALDELDRRLAELARGEIRQHDLGFLFVPTGPLQELAMSSGWGNTFIELANRYDAALGD